MKGDNAQFIIGISQQETRLLANTVFGNPLLQLFGNRPLQYAPGNHYRREAPVFALTAARQKWLLRLERNPAALLDYLAHTRDQRLGALHERLWQFFLENDEDTELLGSNIAVRDNGQTLGEFDMLYRHRLHGLVHLEVACKFYLATDDNTSDWKSWLGPGKRDRLDIKLHKMIQHQANLSDQPVARSALRNAIGEKNINNLYRHLHLGGRLFYPFNPGGQYLLPKALNKCHYRATHMPLATWLEKQNREQQNCALLVKPLWLDLPFAIGPSIIGQPAFPGNGSWLQAKQQLMEKMEAYGQPQMLVQQSGEGYEFIFVTPDNWLD